MSARRCFKCQGLGQIVVDFPNQKVIISSEWEAVKEEEKEVKPDEELGDNKEENQEECLAEQDEGEMFVLRRVLSNQRSEKNQKKKEHFSI